jgi:NADH dehydrogenase
VEWSAELAGARIEGSRILTTLVGDSVRVLPHHAPGVASHADHALFRLGVQLMLSHRVINITPTHVVLSGHITVPYDVVVWAAGVRPHPLTATLGLPVTQSGHLIVTPRLAVPDRDDIYAIGDCARIVESGEEQPTMQRAIEAIWQGASLARRFAAGWSARAGPRHRLRRDFAYGLSLGPRLSAIFYKKMYSERRAFVLVRRWLQWGYYARFNWLAKRLRRSSASRATAP